MFAFGAISCVLLFAFIGGRETQDRRIIEQIKRGETVTAQGPRFEKLKETAWDEIVNECGE